MRHSEALLPADVQHVRRREGLCCYELNSEAIVYDTVSNTLFRLNATSYFIWRTWEETAGIDAVTQRLTEVFDVSPETARSDVRKAVAEMLEIGLLESDTDP